MGRIATFSLFLFLLVDFCGIHAANFTRRELLKNLTSESMYDPSYPSGFDTGDVTEVKVQLNIFDLNSVNDQNMEYSIMMLMRMQWRDDRLAFFGLANHSRLELTGDMINMVWIPDLYISNERKTDAHSLVKHEELVYIDPNGVVSFSIRLSMTSHCHMDLKFYPFDEQTCNITIQSYAFTADKIMLKWSDNGVQVGELSLPNYDVSVDDHTDGNISNGNTSLTEGTFSYLNLPMKFARKSSAYGSMYFAPYPIFFAIAMCSFGFKEQVSSRIILCSTGISTCVLQWIAIYARLPPVWYLTYLDGWIIFHVSIIGAILLYTAVWYICVHQDKDNETDEGNDRNNGCRGAFKRNKVEFIAFLVFSLLYAAICIILLVIWSRVCLYWLIVLSIPVLVIAIVIVSCCCCKVKTS